ncbi:LpxI family protein [Methylobrevis albus]|uniref:UDP-2,3-diacylglucosamine diphosphatase LpxI n=1 Tax=Methylobrevis albus TaxID=2793297 RepID=A0A931I6F6_9HYPH|nr:UDP-2,3-diacylglucosamine diphosphatase LpxI [Methylobrevis albus]MBH0239668.1 UDP-2,3-diacylglucosamine diphosphatase LpxI [Methylobrevis albus]
MNGSAPLGIIAGSGRLPAEVARGAAANGRDVVIFGIDGEADAELARFRHHRVRWGEIGRLFELLTREKVEEIVICGAVSRPDFTAIRLDFGAIVNLPRILAMMVGGDDTVLQRVVRFFEERGFRIVGAHDVVPEIVARPGPIGRLAVPRRFEDDVASASEAVGMLGRLDIGQAVVAVGGRVVGVEGVEGTDELLRRIGELHQRGRLRWSGRAGLLFKAAKPQQDLRVDMPTIGPATVEAAAAAGLAGIVIEAGRVLILDRALTIRTADEAGVFLVARHRTSDP